MTREELREKVARVLAAGMREQPDDAWKFYANDADAAIAIVLEEAANIASEMWIIGHGNLNADPYYAAKQVGDEIAAAIRALKVRP